MDSCCFDGFIARRVDVPDFITDDGFVEIKGYHTDLVDIKTASVNDKKIKVLYGNDLLPMFEYVEQHYQYNKLTDLYD